MKRKIIIGAAAICSAACITASAFAVNTAEPSVEETVQADAYQSDAYLEALDALKKAEQEFIKQEEIAIAEEADAANASEDGGESNSAEKDYAPAPNDNAPIIGGYVSSPYWEALEDLKMADLHYDEVCASLGVEGDYVSILD